MTNGVAPNTADIENLTNHFHIFEKFFSKRHVGSCIVLLVLLGFALGSRLLPLCYNTASYTPECIAP